MNVQKIHKITICVSNTIPVASGDGNNAFDLAVELNKLGYSVAILTLNPCIKYSMMSRYGAIRVIRIPYFKWTVFGKIFSRLLYIPAIFYYSIRSDLIMVYGKMLAYRFSLLFSALFSKKTVFRSTLVDFDDALTLTSKGDFVTKIFHRVLFKMIDCYFAVNPVFTERWISAGFNIGKVFESPQGTNLRVFKFLSGSEKKQIRERLGLPLGMKIICSIGDLSFRKGYDGICQALKCVDEPFHYIILGAKEPANCHRGQKGNGKEMVEVKRIIYQLGDKVSLLGEVNNPHEYLMASDVYIQFSKQEGLPNALQQALACGLPVIVRPVDSIYDRILHENVNCLFAKDVNTLEEKVRELLRDNDLRIRLSNNANETAARILDVEKVTKDFMAFIEI